MKKVIENQAQKNRKNHHFHNTKHHCYEIDRYKCTSKMAPREELDAVRCDMALETMKNKYGCDLRGASGLEAAFG